MHDEVIVETNGCFAGLDMSHYIDIIKKLWRNKFDLLPLKIWRFLYFARNSQTAPVLREFIHLISFRIFHIPTRVNLFEHVQITLLGIVSLFVCQTKYRKSFHNEKIPFCRNMSETSFVNQEVKDRTSLFENIIRWIRGIEFARHKYDFFFHTYSKSEDAKTNVRYFVYNN